MTEQTMTMPVATQPVTPVSPGTAIEQIRDHVAYLTSEMDRAEADAKQHDEQAIRSRAVVAHKAELRSQWARILTILEGTD